MNTIVALCTAQGNGALALIRVSGPDAWAVVNPITRLKSGKSLLTVESHTVHAADIYGTELIDSVMVMALRGPRTFTGFDTVEITCHQNPLIIQAIIERLIAHGARPAQQGEFTRQAYENKKLDLAQAEAINELISAQTAQALKKSLAQLQGSLSAFMHEIEDTLCKTLAWCESSFEFLEDEGDFYQEIEQFLSNLMGKIEPVLKSFAHQQQIRQGYRVALIGGVNAGKSSLFNLLIGHKRAIVTPLAGTTRDSIESTVLIDGATVTLIDTAGLRTTHDIVEQEGIERSYVEAHASDVILLVIDGSAQLSAQEQEIYQNLLEKYPQKIILIQNKSDLNADTHPFLSEHALLGSAPLVLSVVEGYELLRSKEKLEAAILEKIRALSTQHELPFLINRRHYELLQALAHDLNQIQAMLQNSQGNPHYELISYHLRQALEHISQVTGKTVSEQALDRVFKEFCVGK